MLIARPTRSDTERYLHQLYKKVFQDSMNSQKHSPYFKELKAFSTTLLKNYSNYYSMHL